MCNLSLKVHLLAFQSGRLPQQTQLVQVLFRLELIYLSLLFTNSKTVKMRGEKESLVTLLTTYLYLVQFL